MNSSESPVYALADPTEVDVAAIERELESLWRNAAKGEGTASVTRATAFNLIYVTECGDDAAANLLAKLTLDHPSRSVLLLLGNESDPPAQTAWVSAYCHRPNPNAPQICSEFISLECKGTAAAHVASTLRSLMVGGLPTVLVWSAHVDIHHPLLMQFGYDCERVITDVIQAGERVSAINRLWNIRKLFGAHTVVSDALWSALLPTRQAIAAVFDERPAHTITHIHFDSWNTESAVIAAWMAATLAWSLVGAQQKHETVTLNFTKERAMSFTDVHASSRGAGLTFHFADGDPYTVKYVRPDRTLVDLITAELRIWSRDPVFDKTFDLLQEWLARR